MLTLCSLSVLVALLGSSGSAPTPPPGVDYCFGGRITADNSYLVGLGSANGIGTILASMCNTTSTEIFSCDTGAEGFGQCYANAALPTFVYIVAWSDDLETSGVLASLLLDFPSSGFSSNRRSGNPKWRVFATGLDLDDCTSPSLATLNAQIAIANANGGAPGTTSVGWVGPTAGPNGRLEIGEANDATPPSGTCLNAFPQVCSLDPAARWMWYRRPASACAFNDGNQRELLIFRLPMRAFSKTLPK